MKRYNCMRFRPLILVVLLLCAVTTVAQQATGILAGTVMDQQKLAIASAHVTVVNIGSKYTQSYVTDNDGAFRFPALPVGTYDLTVEKQNFRTVKQVGLAVTEHHVATVSISLPVGATKQEIVVTAQTPLVNLESASVQNTLSNRDVIRFGGDYLTGGLNRLLTALPTNTNGGYEGWATFNGGRTEYDTWTLDGAQNQESLNRTAGAPPDVEAIQEVDVVSTLAKAEQGHGSAQINVVTKSGGDQFHGHIAVPLPNKWNATARNFFQARTIDPTTGHAVDPSSRGMNYYSASLGGPVIIPGLYDGRHKTHFFILYGGQRSKDPVLINNSGAVPSDAFRNGDFSSLLPPSNGSQLGMGMIVDPQTGQPFPGNIIPQSRINPLAQKILNDYFPKANLPGGTYFNQTMSETNLDTFLAKIDQQIGSRHALSFNVNGTFVNSTLPAGPLPAFNNVDNYMDLHFGASDLFTITPHLINEFRTMAYRNHLQLDPVNGVNPQSYGFSGVNAPTDNFPYISVSGYAPVGFSSQVEEITNSFEVKDDVSWTHGKHGVKFGADYTWNQGVQNNHILTSGEYLFLGLGTAGLCPAPYYYCFGNAFADFLLGRPYVYVQQSPTQSDIRHKAIALYLQDDWKVLPRLTLNLGLRWSGNTAPNDAKGRMSAYRPGEQSTRFPSAPAGIVFDGDPGIPPGTVSGQYLNFSPRIGFALDLTGHGTTALRGGYGIYYETNPLRQAVEGSVNQPFSLLTSVTPLFTGSSDPFANPFGTGVNPFPYNFKNAQFYTPYSIIGLAKNYVTPYTQQFTLELEHQLSKDLAVTVSYIGVLGTHLQGHNEYNAAVYEPGASVLNVQQRRPNQNFSSVVLYDSAATSQYHSLVVSAQKRYSHGFSVDGGYTFSKNIDSASLSYGPLPQDPSNLAAERALSTLDVRQKFSFMLIWDLPFWNKPHNHLQELAGGWQVNSLWNMHSGSPINLWTGGNNSFNGVYTDRPNQVGNPKLSGGRSNIDKAAEFFNTSAFAVNAPGTFGDASRNAIPGPDYKAIDLGIVKKFQLGESRRIEFEAHALNVLNRVNFVGFITPPMNSPDYGKYTQAYAGRNINFVLKFYF